MYYFSFGANYDDVPIDKSGAVDEPTLENNGEFSNGIRLTMFTPTSIDYLWSSSYGFEEPSTRTECEIAVDYDKACQIVSKELSQEKVYVIEKAEKV